MVSVEKVRLEAERGAKAEALMRDPQTARDVSEALADAAPAKRTAKKKQASPSPKTGRRS